MFGSWVFRNTLGERYVFHFANVLAQYDRVTSMQFDDELAAERFLRSFELGDTTWARLLEVLAVTDNASASSIRQVSLLLQQRRLTVHPLPGSHEISSPQRMIRSKRNHDRYEIVAAAAALLKAESKRQPLADIDQAYATLSALDIDEAQARHILIQAGSDTSVKSDVKRVIASKLAAGDLVLFNHGPLRGPLPKVAEAVADRAAADRPVPLAPESEPWIEIKLIDENGEPVPEQQYWIKDSQGKEYQGTTDKRGVARLDKIPEGLCDISFPELEGWS